MLRRVFTVFLAALLLWSSLATQERPLLQAPDAQALAGVPAGGDRSRHGSVDEHHLDDLPAQFSLEHANDLPAWYPATRIVMALAPGGRAGATPVATQPACNVPDVPLRPPCA